MYGCSVTLFFVFGRRERWRRESLAGAEGTHGGVLKGKGVGAPALPVYRCSPGVRGGGGASQAACGDPGCSQRDPESRGRQYRRLDRRLMQQEPAARSNLHHRGRNAERCHIEVNTSLRKLPRQPDDSS